MKLIFILPLLLSACADSGDSCLNSAVSDLGSYTGQQLVYYSNKGSCDYHGGLSNVSSCSGTITCKDGTQTSTK